jgi:hypothetical protein
VENPRTLWKLWKAGVQRFAQCRKLNQMRKMREPSCARKITAGGKFSAQPLRNAQGDTAL